MKKILILLLTSIIAGTSNATIVSAANGDLIRPIYSTDILTYMDGIPIQGYSIDGKMMICLEDLSNYGFSVYYNDEARTLFVNKHCKANEDFYPVIERGTVGNITGYTYETDITAYLNGQYIETENIGGKLVTTAEDLSDTDNTGYIRDLEFVGFSKYSISYNYDDKSRTLNIFSDADKYNLYEDNLEKYKYCIEGIRKADKIVDSFTSDDYTEYIHQGGFRETTNFDGCSAVRFYKNGLVMDYSNIINAYDFISRQGSSITEAQFSEDGKYLIFESWRSKSNPYSLMGSRHTFESGKYKLDLDTCELIKESVEFYGY